MRSSEPIRPSSRRGASGAWNRLKPVREDVLETYGLPSKGETRLNDYKTQEMFLNKITERYMKLCALNREHLDGLFAGASLAASAVGGEGATKDDLTSSFSRLSASVAHVNAKKKPGEDGGGRGGGGGGGGLLSSKYASASPTPPPPPPPQQQPQPPTSKTPLPPVPVAHVTTAAQHSIETLASVLSALRKLREAITASARTDLFARRAYILSIRISTLCHDWPSYVPALHTLLSTLHQAHPLSASDHRAFAGLHVLDLACRQSDYAGARALKLRYQVHDWKIEAVLKALVADDWVGWWRMRRSVDGYQRAVMEWADGRVRRHALRAVGKAYLKVEKVWLEGVAGREWEELEGDGVGWGEEGGWIMIRKMGGVKAAAS
ncbi:hypothetical protein ACEQ8H_007849 [Pleosporales sp. CAS-2024a]